MAWWMTALLFLWELFKDWIYLFAAPFLHPSMLWITVPVLLNWVFTEIYQEKKGTSLGNAISNGTIMLWVGVDWARITVANLPEQINWVVLITKIIICLLLFSYGLLIIVAGARAKTRVKYYGRIRDVTYFALVLSPIFYDVVQLTWQYVVAAIIFFPLFYFVVEIIDRLTPTPRTYEVDEGKETDLGGGATSLGGDLGGAGSDIGKDFGSDFGGGLGKDFGSPGNVGMGSDFGSSRSSGSARGSNDFGKDFDFGAGKGGRL